MGQSLPEPPPAGSYIPAYVPVVNFTGGLYGDDVNVATANTTQPYAPVNQGNKADMMGVEMAVDITTPRGWISPQTPAGPPPTPVVASLNPTSRVVAPTDNITLHVIGSGFLPSSVIYFGASSNGERTTYVSATELTTIIRGDMFTGVDPAVPVKVVSAGKTSNAINFAFTAAP